MNKNTFFSPKKSININGHLIDLSIPKVMGILNVTPDSFYDGGTYTSEKDILIQAGKLLSEGADFIDIGAVSTRPLAQEIDEEDELQRLLPALKSIKKEFPEAIISVDTYRASIAEKAVEYGAHMINDIGGGTLDTNMFAAIAKLNVPYILMHIQGTPQTMQKEPLYKSVVEDVAYFFSQQINQLKNLGVKDVILDVGFGFGKTLEHNYSLLKHLNYFQLFEMPLLAGISRKGMIYKPLATTPAEALNGTITANTIALLNGASILRVHDVKPAVEAITIVKQVTDAV